MAPPEPAVEPDRGEAAGRGVGDLAGEDRLVAVEREPRRQEPHEREHHGQEPQRRDGTGASGGAPPAQPTRPWNVKVERPQSVESLR